MVYTLLQKCITEFMASLMFIFLGNGVVANELLVLTKGHSIGFGFVSIGYGLAIGFSIAMFGYCSAHLNPASIFGGWILGTVDGVAVVPLMLSEVLGAFVGQLMIFLVYLPHFMIVPELDTKYSETNDLLRSAKQVGGSALRVASHKPSLAKIVITPDDRDIAVYEAALEADRATKLSAFCNRPAVDMPLYNFITEVFCTFALLFGLYLIDDRFNINKDEQITLFYSKGLQSVITGLYITMCILCLGGPTGFSSNPCRDLGPRLAHFILPIKGKGSSEFRYSLIINTAAFVGAAIAAGLFLLLKMVPIR